MVFRAIKNGWLKWIFSDSYIILILLSLLGTVLRKTSGCLCTSL
uniref:Receptor-like serine/threonine-protein kinase At3g01300 n=1 Tax=Rhizophora mucronata TaxID=61149 RepID=A0A2P2IYW5_RHIMU